MDSADQAPGLGVPTPGPAFDAPMGVSPEQVQLVDDLTFHALAVRHFHREHLKLLPTVSAVFLKGWIFAFVKRHVPSELILYVWKRWIAAGHLELALADPASVPPELRALRPASSDPARVDYVPTRSLLGLLERARAEGGVALTLSPESVARKETVVLFFPDLSFSFADERAKLVTILIRRNPAGAIDYFRVTAPRAKLTPMEQALVLLIGTGGDWPLAGLHDVCNSLILATGRQPRGRPADPGTREDVSRNLKGRLERILEDLPYLIDAHGEVLRPGPGADYLLLLEQAGSVTSPILATDLEQCVKRTLARASSPAAASGPPQAAVTL